MSKEIQYKEGGNEIKGEFKQKANKGGGKGAHGRRLRLQQGEWVRDSLCKFLGWDISLHVLTAYFIDYL